MRGCDQKCQSLDHFHKTNIHLCHLRHKCPRPCESCRLGLGIGKVRPVEGHRLRFRDNMCRTWLDRGVHEHKGDHVCQLEHAAEESVQGRCSRVCMVGDCHYRCILDQDPVDVFTGKTFGVQQHRCVCAEHATCGCRSPSLSPRAPSILAPRLIASPPSRRRGLTRRGQVWRQVRAPRRLPASVRQEALACRRQRGPRQLPAAPPVLHLRLRLRGAAREVEEPSSPA